MYCGLCTEACPYEAIQVGGTFKDAVYTFDDMYKDKHALTDLAQEYLRTHDWTYPNGQKAPFPDERAAAVSKSTRGD
jgi:formate hydrogenlyase subunit 6/NADH:ubiquinone oxidoreductase subunit I